jgi:serine/threonine protein kinase
MATLPIQVDVYSLGNIFYMLLQGEYPFDDIETDEAQKLVIQGHRPTFYVDVWNSTDPIDKTIKAVMIKCHEQDPVLRPTAREIMTNLTRFLKKVDPGRLEKWGFQ